MLAVRQPGGSRQPCLEQPQEVSFQLACANGESVDEAPRDLIPPLWVIERELARSSSKRRTKRPFRERKVLHRAKMAAIRAHVSWSSLVYVATEKVRADALDAVKATLEFQAAEVLSAEVLLSINWAPVATRSSALSITTPPRPELVTVPRLSTLSEITMTTALLASLEAMAQAWLWKRLITHAREMPILAMSGNRPGPEVFFSTKLSQQYAVVREAATRLPVLQRVCCRCRQVGDKGGPFGCPQDADCRGCPACVGRCMHCPQCCTVPGCSGCYTIRWAYETG